VSCGFSEAVEVASRSLWGPVPDGGVAVVPGASSPCGVSSDSRCMAVPNARMLFAISSRLAPLLLVPGLVTLMYVFCSPPSVGLMTASIRGSEELAHTVSSSHLLLLLLSPPPPPPPLRGKTSLLDPTARPVAKSAVVTAAAVIGAILPELGPLHRREDASVDVLLVAAVRVVGKRERIRGRVPDDDNSRLLARFDIVDAFASSVRFDRWGNIFCLVRILWFSLSLSREGSWFVS